MRKFMTIFVAVVLCLAALTVFVSAKNTNCTVTGTSNHDWTAWKTVQLNSDGSGLKERTCACGRVETEVIEAPHKHTIAYVPAAEACHVPGIAEYWYCTDCELVFADEDATQVTNRKNLEIAPDCELAYVPAAEACHAAGTAEYWYCPECDAVYSDAEGTALTNRKNLEIAPDTELVYCEAVAACHANGYNEYWYCPDCEGYFADAEGTQITNIKNLTVEGDLSKLQYTAKVEPTATENGMNEYWYCEGCNCFFTDAEGKYNIAYLSLTIPALGEVHVHTIAYVPAAEACHVPGITEYWYCVDCEAVYADAEATILTNRKNLEIAATTELVYHEAVAACHANGYLEYWYCPKCDAYFADAAATQLTNIKNLTVEGDLSKLQYTAKVEPTATENGMNEYWYCEGCNCFFTDAEGKYNIAYLSLTIPATGDAPVNPDTGDNAIFFVVALVAVATLGVAVVSFKKREN